MSLANALNIASKLFCPLVIIVNIVESPLIPLMKLENQFRIVQVCSLEPTRGQRWTVPVCFVHACVYTCTCKLRCGNHKLYTYCN